MKTRSFIALSLSIALLLAGAVGVYAYDAARDDLIAQGVTVAGIDVGGMRAGQARALLGRELAEPLGRPIRVTSGGREFTLSAHRARIHTDVEGMVQDALEESREGNVLSRTVRYLSGDDIDSTIAPQVSWSREAVAGLVKRVKGRVDRKPLDASVSYSAAGLGRVPHKDGLAVRGRELERNINAELSNPDADRVVEARTKVTKPDVTTGRLAARYPYFIIVNRSTFRLSFYKALALKKTYTIAVGAVGFDTPAGLYHVQNKAIDPAWHVPDKPWAGKLAGKVIPGGRADNPIKSRWLGIYNGAGIHGTDAVSSLGSRASHGCIRMAIPEVQELYDQVPVQTPVYIG